MKRAQRPKESVSTEWEVKIFQLIWFQPINLSPAFPNGNFVLDFIIFEDFIKFLWGTTKVENKEYDSKVIFLYSLSRTFKNLRQ